MLTKVKTSEEITNIRVSGHIIASVFEFLKGQVEVGVTTKYLADLSRKEILRLGGETVLLGYEGFPDVICISLNDEVVHGIPGSRVLENGDLISFDLCVGYKGMIADSAFTMIVGEGSGAKRRLLKGTKEALEAGINVLHDGVRTGDVGAAVEKVMTRHGFGIVRDLVGHGVGHEVHEGPDIPNYGIAGTGRVLSEGMTICIEPMSTLGGDNVVMGRDGWTVSTRDGSLSAQFEHTLLITKDSAEIITTL